MQNYLSMQGRREPMLSNSLYPYHHTWIKWNILQMIPIVSVDLHIAQTKFLSYFYLAYSTIWQKKISLSQEKFKVPITIEWGEQNTEFCYQSWVLALYWNCSWLSHITLCWVSLSCTAAVARRVSSVLSIRSTSTPDLNFKAFVCSCFKVFLL